MKGLISAGAELRFMIDSTQWIELSRYHEIVAQSERRGECLLFTGYRPSGAHGRIEHHKQQIYVHRAVFAVLNGPIPHGLNVCHRCDVGNCIEPGHLFLGTQAENVADMWAKGRGKPPPVKMGTNNFKATLSDKEVADLRALSAEGVLTQRELAAQFGCSQSTVWRIIHGDVRL